MGYTREAALAVPEFKNELKDFTVKELRRVTGMTQKAFAEFFEIPERSIENWEGGQRECPDYLLKLMLYRIEKEKGIEIPRFFVCEYEDGNGWEYAFLTREQALDKAEEDWSRLTKRERKGFVDRNQGAHFCVICGYYITDEDIYAFGRKETNMDWDEYYGYLADFNESDI